MKNSNNCFRMFKAILFIFFLFSFIYSKSQVVYTDVFPDKIMTYRPGLENTSNKYYFDVNNDSIDDFYFDYSFSTSGYNLTVSIDLIPLNNIEFIYKQDDWESLIPTPFFYGDSIDYNRNWISQKLNITTGSSPYFGWGNQIDKFIGFRLKSDTNYNYGWFRLKNYKTISDYAINKNVNELIIAGDKIPYKAEKLTITDIANNKDGRDLKLNFGKALNESLISAYRIFVVKASKAKSFTVDSANIIVASNYIEVPTKNANYTINFLADSRDSDGDTISELVPYKAFVLSVANGVDTNINLLSVSSNTLSLITQVKPALYVFAEDIGDKGNGSDISISFTKSPDELNISEYRIIAINSKDSLPFNNKIAYNLHPDNYTQILPRDSNFVVKLSENAKDKDGDLLKNKNSYYFYVLAVANRITANTDSLSLISNMVTLSNPNCFKTGQSEGENIFYTNVEPDSVYCSYDKYTGAYIHQIDLNNDKTYDYTLRTFLLGGGGFFKEYSILEPLNNNEISIRLNTYYPERFYANSTINKDLYWSNENCLIAYAYSNDWNDGFSDYGIWRGNYNNKYMTLRLIENTDTLYGWLGIKITDYSCFIIRDYAYSTGILNSTNPKSSEIKIFPNPTKENVSINFLDTNIEKQINIYDVFGREIFKNKTSNSIETINVSKWEKGIYFVHINSHKGVQTKKLLIE